MEPNVTSTEFAAALRPFPCKCRAKPKGAQVGRRRALWAPSTALWGTGLAGGRCLLPAPRRKGGAERHPYRDRRGTLQDSETRGLHTAVPVADSDTLPVFSKPYNDFFCSSSSCCLLCRHTKHLKDKDVTPLPGAQTLGGDTGLRELSCDSRLGLRG